MTAAAAATSGEQQEGCTAGFFQKLQKRVEAVDSLLCVGLDPHVSELSLPSRADAATGAAAAFSYCERLVQASLPYACCYKPNSAFFEAFGSPGIAALERLCEIIPADIPVLLDVKRGDIGSTAEAYASAAFSGLKVDAVTVNPYLGRDSLLPFLKFKNKAIFVLVKTSNPSAGELQMLQVCRSSTQQQEQPLPLFLQVAGLCNAIATEFVKENHPANEISTKVGDQMHFNAHNHEGGGVGLVAGATDTHALRAVRAACPHLWILSPGVGAQGADLQQALAAGLRKDGSGLIISVSRGISRAKDIAAEAASLRDKINEARRAVQQTWSTNT